MKPINKHYRCIVAEGPLWDDRTNTLWFVDILGECIFKMDYSTNEIQKIDVGQQIGCMALCENGDLLLAMQDGIYRMNEQGEKILAHQLIKIKGRRFNDGKVGPDGCFYVGTTDDNGLGAFYRLKDGVLEELFDRCGCSNGLDWTVDESRLFYCDTHLQKIEVFDFDQKHHTLSNRRTFVEIPKELGCPDGFCMDENNHIWLGLWDGNAILEVKPDGSFGERIDVPAKKASCCIFAGEGLDDLIIATASKGDVDDYPLSGYVFMKKMNVKGKKSFRYKGETNMKKDVMQAIADTGILPVINITDITTALPLAKAILDGGLKALEVTLRSEVSLQAISEIVKNYPDLHILAGTVLTVEQAQAALDAGASGLVMPGYDDEIVNFAIEKEIPIVPGCVTAADIQKGYKKGLRVFKFFPAEQCGGLAAIKLLSGPFKGAKFLPTGGMNYKNIGTYLKESCILACGGSYMADAKLLAAKDFDTVRENCKRAVRISKGEEIEKTEFLRTGIKDPSKSIVGFGDFMLRLNPEGYLKFIQADRFVVNYTGAEANVCTSLSYMGMNTEFVTRLPDNLISECALANLRKFNVGTNYIAKGGDRIGLFYAEKGASQRPSKIVYDRKASAFATCKAEDFDWDKIFKGASHFHFTGITPALGENVAKACEAACIAAKKKGLTVSCDLNYRKNLWTREQAKETMSKLLPYVDILIANEEDSADVLGICAKDTDINSGVLSHEGYIDVAKQIHETYGVPTVAITLRKSISASDNDWSAMLYTGGQAYFSKEYRIHIVDRVGGGDSFGAGLIYAYQNGFEAQEQIEFAAAASCLKQSIELDVNISSVSDILSLMGGNASGRVQR
ncbi:MAG: bifunctional 4-hydroxy-2-oxoglutarate aldolase/2-dehydro-3-deoxy-phosphogluconate aldolase [Clostridia bacterium]|nr:bifunctional 4-hydroxy-2-oxoglutarate aldolase/2-dehydro-3-deoxy-phosphogluconate aldolase [Clostridia bacterium]